MESAGPVASALVKWLKSAYAYIRQARVIHTKWLEVDVKKNQALYLNNVWAKKGEELQVMAWLDCNKREV